MGTALSKLLVSFKLGNTLLPMFLLLFEATKKTTHLIFVVSMQNQCRWVVL